MTLGDFLRERRTGLGWTQPEAAARAKIEQSYLSKLESGRSTPSPEVWHRIANAFAIDHAALAAQLDQPELERLREIEPIQAVRARQQRDHAATTRRWLLAGLGLLMLAGGCFGLNRAGVGANSRFTYQSTGVSRPDESLDVFVGIDDAPDPMASDAGARVARRNALIARIDERTITGLYRGPTFIESVPSGKRVWQLVGKADDANRLRDWTLPAAWAFLLGAIGCFFVSWRWPRGSVGV